MKADDVRELMAKKRGEAAAEAVLADAAKEKPYQPDEDDDVKIPEARGPGSVKLTFREPTPEETAKAAEHTLRCVYITAAAPQRFRPGDVVRLKSGGPKMTVDRPEDLIDKTSVLCRWFRRNGRLDIASFPPELLQKRVDTPQAERI